MRKVLLGGFNPNPEMSQFLSTVLDCPIQHRLGMSEATVVCSTSHLDPSLGSVGGPQPQVKIRLKSLPELGYSVKDLPNPRGALLIKGFTVMPGYLWLEEKNKEVFDEEGWYNTGDIAEILPNGAVKLVNRATNIVKLRTPTDFTYC